MEQPWQEDNDDLSFDNELEKLKMQAEFGAMFSETGEGLPPELEAEWLANIRNFEEQQENVKQQKIYDILGQPKLRANTDVPDDEVEAELEKVMDMMSAKGLELDHDADVPARELYRFITEELMEHETEIYAMPGWTTHMIYEEFHPNHEKDIIRTAEMFFQRMVEKKDEWLAHQLDNELVFGQSVMMTKEEFIEKVMKWTENFETIRINQFLFQKPEYDLNQGMGHVHVFLDYDGITETGDTVSFTGPGIFYLRVDDGWWSIFGMNIPGIRELLEL